MISAAGKAARSARRAGTAHKRSPNASARSKITRWGGESPVPMTTPFRTIFSPFTERMQINASLARRH
jgi:hypothetical protein